MVLIGLDVKARIQSRGLRQVKNLRSFGSLRQMDFAIYGRSIQNRLQVLYVGKNKEKLIKAAVKADCPVMLK